MTAPMQAPQDCGTFDLGCRTAQAVSSVFDDMVTKIAQGAADLIVATSTWGASTDSVDPTDSAVITAQGATRPVVAIILTASILVQAIRMILSRKAEPLVMVATGLIRFVAVSALGLTTLQMGLRAGDSLSQELLDGAADNFALFMKDNMTHATSVRAPELDHRAGRDRREPVAPTLAWSPPRPRARRSPRARGRRQRVRSDPACPPARRAEASSPAANRPPITSPAGRADGVRSGSARRGSACGRRTGAPASDVLEADVAREATDNLLGGLRKLGIDHEGGITRRLPAGDGGHRPGHCRPRPDRAARRSTGSGLTPSPRT
jgi:hypothetical protein